MDASIIRERIRSGKHQGTTSGIAGDKVQANLVVLPRKYAFDFLLFAVRNKKAVPIIEVLEDGRYESLHAKGSDVRTDVPKYNIYRYGELIETVDEVKSYWQEDFVTFLIGCSFTFEQAIMDSGIDIKHIREGRNVAMYKTDIPAEPAGKFHGRAVVSMRPFKKEDVDDVIAITEQFPDMHGGPVHVGNPGEIGIANMEDPDYGDPIDIADDEVPVFWACGVTPQNVALNAKPDIMITHLPGHMFITDINNEDYKE
ncbi:putative hydro-lyase [Salinicoccus halitifaciens]|uniref:Putative hydro-lyase ABHD89_001841 n=1 Tax=Salinicoccus halitifaciens TaxID=1073415 RepID=A0ABV2EBC3_9STAP|nr:putative hydro-lyase [Salinicoccus halitifaciens]MCD2138561.1 putative hydro-lyase [Salinicoccus halitifaciens]